MKESNSKLPKTISEIFKKVCRTLIVFYMLISLYSKNFEISQIFISIISILYLSALSLDLMVNVNNNKKLTYAGIALLIFTIFVGGYNLINSIKWYNKA